MVHKISSENFQNGLTKYIPGGGKSWHYVDHGQSRSPKNNFMLIVCKVMNKLQPAALTVSWFMTLPAR